MGGDCVTELVLHCQVPLLTLGRLEVLIGHPDALPGKTRQVDGRTVGWRGIPSRDRSSRVSHFEDSQGRVHSELFVGSTTFRKAGNGVATADDCFLAQSVRRP